MSKKKLLVLALVAIMIATLSFSTLAWFTADDSAKNDFSIGGANTSDPDKIFSVDVKENVDGKEEAVDNMDFEKILPGDNHKKEAYITNTGSYEQYIRVVMTVTDWKLIEDLVTINMDDAFNNNWYISPGNARVYEDVLVDFSNTVLDENGSLVVTMYLNKKLAPGETVNIMDYVAISTEATQYDFADPAFADGFQITFDADAAQTEHILSDYIEKDDRDWYKAMKTFEALEANP